jgi:hypothetical protein
MEFLFSRKISETRAYIILFLFSFFCNLGISSLSVMPDEAIYWSGAASIYGYVSDAFGSWSLGYSIILSPLFIFFDSYEKIFFAIKVVNSIIYIINVHLIFTIYRELISTRYFSLKYNIIVPVLVSLYPFYIIITGYVMSENVMTTLFLCLNVIMLKPLKNNSFQCVFMALLCGAIFTINPKGAVIFIATTLSLVIFKPKLKLFDFLLFVTVFVLLVFLYKQYENYIHQTMALGPIKNHYPSLSSMLSVFFDKDSIFWGGVRLTGHLLYLSFSTLGLFLFGFFICLKNIFNRNINTYILFLLLSISGTLALSVLMFTSASDTATRIDHFMYGRYIEPLIAPIILIGLIYMGEKKLNKIKFLAISSSIMCTLFFAINVSGFWGISYMNISSLWPVVYFDTLIYNKVFWLCLALPISFLLINRINVYFILVAAFFILSIILHEKWHYLEADKTRQYDTISSYIRNNYLADTCILYNTSKISNVYEYIPFYHMYWRVYNYPIIKASANNTDCKENIYFSNYNFSAKDIKRLHFFSDWYLYERENIIPLWDSTVRLSDNDLWISQILNSGWYNLETDRVWSSQHAILDLSYLDNTKRHKNLILEFSVFGKQGETKEVSFYLGGNVLTKSYVVGKINSISLPLNLSDTIDIEVSEPVSPESIGLSGDKRILGILLSNITIE